jgi:hypothetical protein
MRAFHFLSKKAALDDIANQRLKISRFDDLNDPFELYGAELSDSRHRVAFRRFKKQMANRFGLLCFSKSCGNPLLWSHYGDRHSGVSLEFEISNDFVNEVSYEADRLFLDIEQKLARGGLKQDDVRRILTTKFKQWEYEEEVRVFLQLTDPPTPEGLHFQNFGGAINLVGLVRGPLCKLTNREITQVLPKGRELLATTSRLAFRSFEVVPNLALRPSTLRGTA